MIGWGGYLIGCSARCNPRFIGNYKGHQSTDGQNGRADGRKILEFEHRKSSAGSLGKKQNETPFNNQSAKITGKTSKTGMTGKVCLGSKRELAAGDGRQRLGWPAKASEREA